MEKSQFSERIAKIRARFAAKLADKIQQTDAALPNLAGDGSDAVEAVATTYRQFHDVCGIGATVGFEATGRLARNLDAVLVGPFRDRRGLSGDELVKLKEALESLRIGAQTEMQSKDSNRELAN
jgi:chemotaxis protein histidine kinase CheA